MRVPRPFDPEEVNQPRGKESQKHVEREEKPLATENQQQSEDFHGGNESTESMPDSPNEGSEEQQKEQQNDNSQQSQNNDESNAGNDQQSQSPSKEQGRQTSSDESNDESSTSDTSETSDEQNSGDGKQGESQHPSGKTEGNNSQSSSETQQSERTSQSGDSEESVDNEQRETSDSTSQESNGETSNDSSDVSDEGDASDDADDSDGQDDGAVEPEEQEEVSDSDEESECQVNPGTYNTNQVFTYVEAENSTKLSRALYDFIEYVADETRAFNNLSTDYYEPKKLMLRRYQGKSLNATKSGKVRETIVVLLDNSGSMDWVREHVLETARALIQRHDAEIYFAPNGQIECQITKQGEVPVIHGYVINKIVSQQLKVLFIGDFDGAETPIELSWKTKVFWLCPESRYRRFQSHKWIHYDESAFRGFFARAYDAREMVQALKRFSGFTQFSRYWYDPHEREVFEDD